MTETAPATAEVTDTGQLILRGSQGLRAIAHPARAFAINKLMEAGPLTATELGRQTGVSASAMSYHLRQLAKWGLVRRLEGPADGRERPWQATGTNLSVLPDGTADFSPALVNTVVGRFTDKLLAAVGRLSRHDATQPEPGSMSYATVWLTDEARTELIQSMRALIEAHSQDDAEGARQEGAGKYEVWNFIIADAPHHHHKR